jgi:tetratricopeptide (TPR) repeat protein
MDSRHEEIKAEAHKLSVVSEQFWAQTDAKSFTVPELIVQFMNSTADPTVPEISKLHSFALLSYDHLGWNGLCEVYEYILANDLDPGGESMNYYFWASIGMDVMKDAENHSFDERVRVAADVEALFEREAKESGEYSEIVMAYFYYDHPLKAEQPQFYLLKSKEWFERAIESDECNECDHHVLQTLGHVFFELGDFKTALLWYKKFMAVGNYCGDSCVMDHALTEKRLGECRQRMTEQDS